MGPLLFLCNSLERERERVRERERERVGLNGPHPVAV